MYSKGSEAMAMLVMIRDVTTVSNDIADGASASTPGSASAGKEDREKQRGQAGEAKSAMLQ